MNKNEQFVITINRELGSGGRTVGRILAEKLGVAYYDKALTKPLEEKFNLTSDQIEYLKNNARTSRYDTRNYDLVITMDDKTEEEAVNVILAYIG